MICTLRCYGVEWRQMRLFEEYNYYIHGVLGLNGANEPVVNFHFPPNKRYLWASNDIPNSAGISRC
jgi:hypothetical protein